MLLDNTEWNSLFSEDEPKIAFKMFEDNINSCFEKAFPLENKIITKRNTPREPWMTAGILTSRKTKNKLAAKKSINPSEDNINLFKTYNKAYRSTIRYAKSKHY